MIKVLRAIINIIFTIIIIFLIGYYILRIENKIEVFSVATGSMEENIHVGDYIVIIKKGPYISGKEKYILHQ